MVVLALIVMFPSVIDKMFSDLKSFIMFFVFFILILLSLVYRLIKHIIRGRKAEKVFFKVDEKGLYLNDDHPCFLKWTQIDRIEICGKPKGAKRPSLYLDVYRKKDRVIDFYLDDYMGSISTSDLINAINTFSGRPDMAKIRKWYE